MTCVYIRYVNLFQNIQVVGVEELGGRGETTNTKISL